MKKILFILLLFNLNRVYAKEIIYLNEDKEYQEISLNNDLILKNKSNTNYIFDKVEISIDNNSLNESININKLKIKRSSNNEPLMYLYNGKPLNDYELSDISISNKLKQFGYKGIDDLDKYYIEYLNKNYNTHYKNMNDIEIKYLSKIFNQSNSNVYESNNKIIVTYYSMLYKYLALDLSNTINESLKYKTIDINKDLEINQFNIKNIFYIDDIDISIKLLFKENNSYGRVNIYYIDTFGNYINDVVTISKLIGTEYEIKDKEINDYYLVRRDGNSKGVIKENDQDIYYMYDFINQNVNTKIENKYIYYLIILVILFIFLGVSL